MNFKCEFTVFRQPRNMSRKSRHQHYKVFQENMILPQIRKKKIKIEFLGRLPIGLFSCDNLLGTFIGNFCHIFVII